MNIGPPRGDKPLPDVEEEQRRKVAGARKEGIRGESTPSASDVRAKVASLADRALRREKAAGCYSDSLARSGTSQDKVTYDRGDLGERRPRQTPTADEGATTGEPRCVDRGTEPKDVMLQRIQQRIRSGFYNRPEVRRVIADRLVRKLESETDSE